MRVYFSIDPLTGEPLSHNSHGWMDEEAQKRAGAIAAAKISAPQALVEVNKGVWRERTEEKKRKNKINETVNGRQGQKTKETVESREDPLVRVRNTPCVIISPTGSKQNPKAKSPRRTPTKTSI